MGVKAGPSRFEEAEVAQPGDGLRARYAPSSAHRFVTALEGKRRYRLSQQPHQATQIR
jgi:hypothetical protein